MENLEDHYLKSDLHMISVSYCEQCMVNHILGYVSVKDVLLFGDLQWRQKESGSRRKATFSERSRESVWLYFKPESETQV